MFVNEYEEVRPEAITEVSGAFPLVGSKRSLVRAFKGRFCFDFGLATSCLKTTVSLTEGESYGLGVSVGAQWGSISHNMTYTMERTYTYEVGECDSASPVLTFDDAELHVYEGRRSFLGMSWGHNETRFIPGRRPVLCGNKVNDDPVCGCSSDRPPTGNTDDRHTMEREAPISRTLRTSTFSAAPLGSPAPDPDEAVVQASQMLEEAVGDSEEVALIGMGGETTRLNGPRSNPDSLQPILLSTDCNAGLRGRLLIRERDPHFPLLAVTPPSAAASGEVTLYLDEQGHLVRFLEQPAHVLVAQFTSVWAGVDFSEIPAGTSGLLELRLTDYAGQQVGQPMRQRFDVIQQPVRAAAEVLVPA